MDLRGGDDRGGFGAGGYLKIIHHRDAEEVEKGRDHAKTFTFWKALRMVWKSCGL